MFFLCADYDERRIDSSSVMSTISSLEIRSISRTSARVSSERKAGHSTVDRLFSGIEMRRTV
jgi:hypothetical protein